MYIATRILCTCNLLCGGYHVIIKWRCIDWWTRGVQTLQLAKQLVATINNNTNNTATKCMFIVVIICYASCVNLVKMLTVLIYYCTADDMNYCTPLFIKGQCICVKAIQALVNINIITVTFIHIIQDVCCTSQRLIWHGQQHGQSRNLLHAR